MAIVLLAFCLLLLKLILLPFSQTSDPDAVVRILQSEAWKNNPQWIGVNVWGPFNYYLNGIGLMIYDNRIIVPKLINIVCSVLCVFPIYGYIINQLGKKTGLLVVLIFSFCTMVFRNSFMAMSEIPYIFFVASSLYFLHRFLRFANFTSLILSGLSITISAGFRYEAWAIMGCFFVMLLLKKKYKAAFLFSFFAGLFPLIWLISNHYYTGDFLYSLKGNYRWTQEVMQVNKNVSFEGWLRRIWFLPFSYFIAFGPAFLFLVIWGIIKSWKKENYGLWRFPLTFMFILLIYSSINGTLLHHHRFVLTIVLFSLIFLGYAFNHFKFKFGLTKTFLLAFSIMIGGTFVYNTDKIHLVPRISDQSVIAACNHIRDNKSKNSMVMIDFFGWDNTYFIALQSQLPADRLQIIDGFEEPVSFKNKIDAFKAHSGEKILIMRKDNSEAYTSLIQASHLQLRLTGNSFYLYGK